VQQALTNFRGIVDNLFFCVHFRELFLNLSSGSGFLIRGSNDAMSFILGVAAIPPSPFFCQIVWISPFDEAGFSVVF